MTRALITGVTGQDGSYLAELLLERGYEVHGITRRVSGDDVCNIQHILSRVSLHNVDLLDGDAIANVVADVRPCEIYNLASQSSVHESWQHPVTTSEVTALGVTTMLDVVRKMDSGIRFFQASSSEIFGIGLGLPLNEKSPLNPVTPYGVSKAYAHFMTACYREKHGLFACSGILFNHESERRGLHFATRRISDGVARIRAGLQSELHLGDLRAKRDWGFAEDYVRAMWLMMQKDSPADFVIGTGELHSVADFVEVAFQHAGLEWQRFVKTSPELCRPTERYDRVADARMARDELGWIPQVDFEALVKRMVDADMHRYGITNTGESFRQSRIQASA